MNKPDPAYFTFHESMDAAFLHELYAGDLGYAVNVFRDVAAELPQHREELRAAFRQNDARALKGVSHKCKTLFAYVGLHQIKEQLRQIEQACHAANDTKGLQPQITQLERLWAEAEQVLETETKRLEAFHEKQD